jgi:PAS domain S-box-containing protein
MTNDPVTPERLPAGAMERLFELAPDLLGTASLDGYLTCINPAWQKTLGWAQEQLMSEPLRHFLHPDDLDETTRRVTLLGEGATSGAITLEHRCATSAGGYRWIEWTVTIDDREYYVIGRDISDRKAAEGDRDRATSLTKAIVESAADGIVVADARGQLRHTNPTGARLLGYEPAAPVDRLNIHATRHHSHLDNSPFPAYDRLAHGRLVLYGHRLSL